jgi:VIT1/CCC1 family predicted Fe2+/Mn2+ transporter
MDAATQLALQWAARNEITEHLIYKHIASHTKHAHNREVLEKIAAQERSHHALWTRLLGYDVKPSKPKVWLYTTMSAVLGLSFSLKLMEKGERLAQKLYGNLSAICPEATAVMRDEQRHEEELLSLIDEGFLRYVSSFVLGLNDALVELTGALAGLTLALRDTKLIAVVGLITGTAASLSMAASQYLSVQEDGKGNAVRASLVTGAAYIVTVLVLIAPYLVIENAFTALVATLALAILAIFVFTFYVSVAKGLRFRHRFAQMAAISLSVAVVNFFVGFGIKKFFGVE